MKQISKKEQEEAEYQKFKFIFEQNNFREVNGHMEADEFIAHVPTKFWKRYKKEKKIKNIIRKEEREPYNFGYTLNCSDEFKEWISKEAQKYRHKKRDEIFAKENPDEFELHILNSWLQRHKEKF